MRGSPAEASGDQGVVGAVLAGGESKRMGQPKAFVAYNGVPMIAHALATMDGLFPEVYVVARHRGEFAHLGAPVIEDAIPGRGPLVGVYTALVRTGARWCFVAGCDMPVLSPALVWHMRSRVAEGLVVAGQIDGWIQPLPAFYSRDCLPVAGSLLERGVTGLRALLRSCSVAVVPEADVARLDPRLRSFADVDTPEQLAELEREVAR